MLRTIAAIVAISAAPAAAETITFQSDDEIMIVRGKQALEDAVFDLIGSEDGSILCVAIAEDGKPIATATSFAEMGRVRFSETKADRVAKVACRYN